MKQTHGRGQVRLSPIKSSTRAPLQFAGSGRAHEPQLHLQAPSSGISVSIPGAPSGPFSCALRICTAAPDHNTMIFYSPKGEGFPPSPEGTLNKNQPVPFILPIMNSPLRPLTKTYSPLSWSKIYKRGLDRSFPAHIFHEVFRPIAFLFLPPLFHRRVY